MDGIILTRSSTHEKQKVMEMFSAQRVESPSERRWKCVALGIVDKPCGAIRACSEPGDTRIQVRIPITPANESSP